MLFARLILKIFPDFISKKIKEEYHQYQRDKSTPNWTRNTSYNLSNNIKIGFVGAGNYATHHLNSLKFIKGVEFDSILTNTGKSYEKIRNEYGFKESFTDIDEFIKRDIDAYFVVSSSDTLFDITKKLFSNKKPILMEKPPGFTSAQTKELLSASEQYKTFGIVALNRRFYSDIQNGLAMLANYGPIRGAILEVPESISNVRNNNDLKKIEYENYFFRNSIHGFDTLRHIMGEVVKLKSFGFSNKENNNRGLSAGAVVEHENKKYSTITTLWDTNPFYWKIKIIAENGYLEFSEKGGTKLTDNKLNIYNISENKVDKDFRKGNFMQTLSFIKVVDKKSYPEFPLCDLKDAIKTMEFMEKYQEYIKEES